MTEVRGPFLEYECRVCGHTVKEKAPRNTAQLDARISELNNNDSARRCAGCEIFKEE